MTWKPLTTKSAGFLGHLRVDRMPDEGRQQGAGSVLLCRAHAGQNLQAGDLTGVQGRGSARTFKERCSVPVTS
jgi:uncharacterized membrane-anchored protein